MSAHTEHVTVAPPDAAVSHYVELVLQPDPEFGAPMLMAALFVKLHRALVAAGPQAGIGVSWPGHLNRVPTLGSCLRLHGSAAGLAGLMETAWLRGVRDHLLDPAPEVRAVPGALLGHRVVSRVQAHSSAERMRRRLMRRQQLDEETARQRIRDEAAQQLKLPFVPLNSGSTGQAFRLFIQHGEIQPQAVAGSFNRYGLSQQGATVPWF